MAGHDLASDDSNSNVSARKAAGSRRPHSKSAEEPLIPVVFVTIKKGSKTVMLKALLDSSAGASLIAEKHSTGLK
eukprot:5277982-Ditylum_brightwellii.AAC.1